jgi:murein L,D-transpeptidase YafK
MSSLSGRSQKPRAPRRGFVRVRASPPSRIAKGGAASLLCFPFFLILLALAIPCAASDALAKDAHADKVLVLKSDRTLELLDHGKILKKYKVALGGAPVGKKEKQGDHKTPEGLYTLDRRNEHSQFYRSLHVSYSHAEDREQARKSRAPPGGDIMLHGLPNGYGWIGSRHRLRDWTDGCIAVTNEEIDEIWRAVADGTPIEIRP